MELQHCRHCGQLISDFDAREGERIAGSGAGTICQTCAVCQKVVQTGESEESCSDC